MYQRLGDEMIEHGSKLVWQALAACIKSEQPITVSASQPFKRLALYRLIFTVSATNHSKGSPCIILQRQEHNSFRGPKCCA